MVVGRLPIDRLEELSRAFYERLAGVDIVLGCRNRPFGLERILGLGLLVDVGLKDL